MLCCFEPTYCIRSGLKSTKCISLTQGSVFEVVGLQHISTVTLWLLTIGYGYSKGYRFALIPGLQPTIHHLRSYCVKTTPLMSLSTMTQGPWTAQWLQPSALAAVHCGICICMAIQCSQHPPGYCQSKSGTQRSDGSHSFVYFQCRATRAIAS